MNALTGSRFVEQAVNDVDLSLQRFEGLQRLAEHHVGAISSCAPMIFIDAASHEHHAEALGKSRRGWRVSQRVERLEPRERHGGANAAKNGSAGYAGVEHMKNDLSLL